MLQLKTCTRERIGTGISVCSWKTLMIFTCYCFHKLSQATFQIDNRTYNLSKYSQMYPYKCPTLDAPVAFFDTNKEFWDVQDYLLNRFKSFNVLVDILKNKSGEYWRLEPVSASAWVPGKDECRKSLTTECNVQMTQTGLSDNTYFSNKHQVLCRHPCKDGFYLDTSNASCIDVDECLSSPCKYTCNNVDGTYSCGCNEGYVLGMDVTTCEDVDECKDNISNCSQLCNNTVGGYTCSCHQGYELHNDSRFLCVDVDECGLGTHNCSDGCNNTAGSYVCTCKDGYHIDTHDPFTCVDMDECQQGLHNCTQNCTNINGSYVCSCFHGYRLDNNDNVTCLDINECKENVHTCENTCVNTLGSYTCTCPLGYQLDQDGSSCVKTRSQPSCPCSCRTQTRINMSSTLKAVQKEIDQIKKNLTVETHELSSYIRSKTSATDDRTTSETVGLFGAILFGITMGVVVVPDVITLIKFLLSKLRLICRKQKINVQ